MSRNLYIPKSTKLSRYAVHMGPKPLNETEKKQVKKIVKRSIASEEDWKYLDIVNGPLSISTTGTVIKLTDPMAQGDGASQREGYEVTARRLELRMSVEGATNQVSYATVRVALIRDNQRNYAGTPTYATVFEASTPESAYLYTNVKSKRFTVIFDRLIEVSPAQLITSLGTQMPITGGPNAHNYQIIKKKLNHKILWDQGSIPGYGHYYLVLISDLGTGSGGTNPLITEYARLYYND